MSMDRSLKSKASLSRHRNVLSRAERIKVLEDQEKFTKGTTNPYGLPKVPHRKANVGGKTKKAAPKEGEAVAGAAPAAGAAPPAAGAAPAAGAKEKPKAKGKGKD
jgi:small basic protein (TIGR04137 family)